MMKAKQGVLRWQRPIMVWLVLLGAVFFAEYAVMLVLPWLLGNHASRALEAGLDAVILTALLAPALWWTIVRPLTEVIRLRSQFLADLFAHIEQDRRQTAHELHDGVGQSLSLLISGLRSAKVCRATEACSGRVYEFQRLAEEALAEVRRLSLGLRPSLLDDLGLAPALERLADDVRTHHPVQISLELAGITGLRLPEQPSTAVFRIVQEALSNIIKHSQAKQVTIRIRSDTHQILVEVGDDGCGIKPDIVNAPPLGHLGLRGMRERATLLGGTFSLDTAPGRGTRVSVAIPVKGAQRG